MHAHGRSAVTLSLRSRLTLIYGRIRRAAVATSAVSYRVLAYQLDADVTESLSSSPPGSMAICGSVNKRRQWCSFI
jgi:hypothetical protein